MAVAHPRFHERGVPVVAISVDTAKESTELAQEIGITFPLLQDADLSVADAYGVADADAEIAIPAVFIIAKDKTIRWRKIGETQADRADADTILAELEPLMAK